MDVSLPAALAVKALADMADAADNPFADSPVISEANAFDSLMTDALHLAQGLQAALGGLVGIYSPEAMAPVAEILAALAADVLGGSRLAEIAAEAQGREIAAAAEAEAWAANISAADLVGMVLHSDGTPMTEAEIAIHLQEGI